MQKFKMKLKKFWFESWKITFKVLKIKKKKGGKGVFTLYKFQSEHSLEFSPIKTWTSTG